MGISTLSRKVLSVATVSEVEEAKLNMSTHEGGYQLPTACLILGLISRAIEKDPKTIKLCKFDNTVIGKNIVVCDISGHPVVICGQVDGGTWKVYTVYTHILRAAQERLAQEGVKEIFDVRQSAGSFETA